MNSNKTLLLCRVGFSSHRRRGRRCLFVLCFFSSARRRDFFSALPQLGLLLHDSHSRFLYYALLWLEYFPPRICRIHFIIAQNKISIVCAKLLKYEAGEFIRISRNRGIFRKDSYRICSTQWRGEERSRFEE